MTKSSHVCVFFQRRDAEPRICFETFQAVIRACPLTFGEGAEAVGTLRGFPLRGVRRGLRRKWDLVSNELKIILLPSRKENLGAFCRAQTSASPFVRLLRPHATASTAMHFCVLFLAEPLRLCASALEKNYCWPPQHAALKFIHDHWCTHWRRKIHLYTNLPFARFEETLDTSRI